MFKLVPAGFMVHELSVKIMEATANIENDWFFYDGAFNTNMLEANSVNTWLYENFVALYNGKIFAYFEGNWQRPLDVVTGFRTINFDPKLKLFFTKAAFKYIDHLFVNRGCMALNWNVATENVNALNQYERLVKNYCGHKVGRRFHSLRSYSGKTSDMDMFEITKSEYFEWKDRGFKQRAAL
jgi:hypothetical protein